MNEIQRFWMRLPRMNPRESQLEQWWFDMLDRMFEEDPVSFAGMQFDAAMKAHEPREKSCKTD